MHARFPLLLLAAVAYGLFIYALLPDTVVLLDDDFGYLKSVIQTFQHRRPWTDNFLEPWSASTSSLAASTFALTGNFYLSTYGLHAVFATAALLALCALFSARGFSPALTLTLSILVLTFPVLLWRALEYTGMALYLPCLLWAIWAAERRRWGVFAIAWLLAVANRQSAVVWLAWPSYVAVQALRLRVRAEALRPGFLVLGGIVAVASLHAAMNSTDSQRLLLDQTMARFEPQSALRTLGAGAMFVLIGCGLSAALQSLSGSPPCRRMNWGQTGFCIAVALGVLLLLLDERRLTVIDRIDVGSRGGWLYTKVVVLVSLAGWTNFRFRLRPAPILCATASILMTSLRPGTWDYYFVDAALLGFFAVSTPPAAGADASSLITRARFWRPALVVTLTFIGLFHLRSALHLKTVLDEAEVVCSLYESALRRGRIRHHELSDAPFAYAGWHLYAHALSRRADVHSRWFSSLLAGSNKRVELRIAYADSFPLRWRNHDRLSPDPNLPMLAEETVRIGWFWHCRYALQRVAPPTAPGPLGPDFHPILFPLTNAEWRELANGPTVP